MMSAAIWKWIPPVIAGIALLLLTLYAVDESEVAIVTQFGRPLYVVRDAGLHAKWPWQSRILFDRRLQTFNPVPSELLTRDKKNLIVDAYVVWLVADPERYLQAVGDRAGAESRLQDVLKSELSIALGNSDLGELVSTDARRVRIDPIMEEVTTRCAVAAREQFGLEVRDVRLRRINLPEENKESVFARMRAERERIARQYRAEGNEAATRIRAGADRQKTEILARAYQQAETLRGEGDAKAMRIYAAACNRDPQFYRLTRTLAAYKRFLNEKTTVVLSSDSELMRLLTTGKVEGRGR